MVVGKGRNVGTDRSGGTGGRRGTARELEAAERPTSRRGATGRVGEVIVSKKDGRSFLVVLPV